MKMLRSFDVAAVRAATAARLREWRATYPAVLRRQLAYHWVPLVLVGLAALAVQAVLLTTPYQPGFFEDSHEYSVIGQNIAQTGIIFDPNRPPSYPIFLAVVAIFGGWGNSQAVVWAQALFMVVAAVEVYFLGYLLTRRRWIATVVALLIAINLPTINMERSVLSESLAYWAAITLFLVFARFMQTRRRRDIFGFAALSVFAILERPAFLFVPLLLVGLELLRTLRLSALRQRWRYLLFCLVAVYGCVALYICGNGIANDYLGFTYISSVNLFGKVIEYQMWDDVTDPSLAPMKHDVDVYIEKTKPPVSPWGLSAYYPDKGYDSHYYAKISAYTDNIILHHPLKYLERSYHDIGGTFSDPPGNLVPLTPLDAPWQMAWIALSDALLRTYSYVFPLALGLLVAVVIWPRRTGLFVLFGIALTTLANAVLVAMTDYSAFYRLRSPMDWGAVFVVFTTLLWGGEVLVRRLRERGREATQAEVQPQWATTAIRPPSPER